MEVSRWYEKAIALLHSNLVEGDGAPRGVKGKALPREARRRTKHRSTNGNTLGALRAAVVRLGRVERPQGAPHVRRMSEANEEFAARRETSHCRTGGDPSTGSG